MQYQHGGSRSRMAPFARGGGAYNRGQKQFYPPPPPPPPLPAAAPLQNKYEVLMEAGRLAAEYLVATGVLPPGSLQARGGGVATGGWGQLPPPPPLPAAQEAPVYHNPRNDRGRADREYSNPNARSRRSRGGDYSSSNSSNYNIRGKRKFGVDNRYSDLGRDRDRGRGHSDSRSYDEEDEDGAPGFRREQRSSAVADEVGSSVSGVSGEGTGLKVEAMGESELEYTGSKVSSDNNIQKNAGVAPEVENENEANKMQEDKVSDSKLVGEGNSNHVSSDVVQETERKHSPVPSDEKVLGERHEDSSALIEKVEDDETLDNKAEDDLASDAKLSLMEDSSHDNANNLLNYCSFARVPKRPRSLLAHRNTGSSKREISVAEHFDLVSSEEVCPVANDGAAIGNSVADIQADSNNDLVCQEHDNQRTACNQAAESVSLHQEETQVEMEEMIEQSDDTQRYGDQENTERSELIPPLAPCQNSLTWQIEKGIPIYNVDTPPQDEELIDPSDKGKTSVPELLPNIGAESAVAMEEQNLAQSGSFKIRDLNLVGSPDEMRNNPRLGQCSTAGCSIELQDKQQINFETIVDKNANNMSSYALLENKEIIDIEDDSLIAADPCDTSKVKTEIIYPSMENMMNPPMNTDILQGVQDGYNIAIPDYLGADMPCYQSIQTDLQAGMGLNDSGSITVMEDSIYGSLGDIGFMGVWDQPPQDYEKFF